MILVFIVFESGFRFSISCRFGLEKMVILGLKFLARVGVVRRLVGGRD